ncbi:MAG: PHA/PHB synthase family protein [Geminicoccaceae bacterium]
MSNNPASSNGQGAEIIQILGEIAGKSQALVSEFLEHQREEALTSKPSDPLNIGSAFFELTQKLMTNPHYMVQAQFSLWQDYLRLWHSTTQRMLGQEPEPVVVPERGDRRFRDPDWEENALFDFIKQSYLLTSRWLMETVNEVDGFDEQTKRKIDFYTKQYVDALSPSNFLLTNPEVIRLTLDSRGENLLRGLKNMLSDIERGKGKLQIRMTDLDAFELGKNVASTPGKVVFQNDFMQLLQYSPSTEQVSQVPLLIIPPWINKYYVLDLQPKNSFIKFAVDQGFTVFVISWVNPDATYAHRGFEDYMLQGPLAAIDAIEQATGSKDVTAVGYCIGGTLLISTLAYMAAHKDTRIKASTFFTTMIDFEHPGELEIFIDEEQLQAIERTMTQRGYLDGAEMAGTFNMLRANDLVWSFVVNNYLLGKEPFPFDLLYWNSDSTRMPCAMHSFYLRKMYLENKLIEPGGIVFNGTPIDITKVRTPLYFLSAKEDHIAPWTSTYSGFNRLKSPNKQFVLAGSGHIAGVINPPAANKYCYWQNSKKNVAKPEDWLDGAARTEGSWWLHWADWTRSHAGDLVDARVPGDGQLAVIEDAPGSYVKYRAA